MQYHGVYFTISSASLTQKSSDSNAGVAYEISFSFSLPNFSGSAAFIQQFSQLSEIMLQTNTGTQIRLNRNDVSLNSPIVAKIKSNLKTIDLDYTIIQLYPLDLNEQ